MDPAAGPGSGSARDNAASTSGDLVLARRVTSVELGRLGVGVTEPLLHPAQGRPAADQVRAERVAQVVKSNDAHTGLPARVLKAARDLRPVQRPAGMGVGEDEIVL